jgi:hypothetical protein
MTVYRRIEIVNGESAEPVAWVGVHPVNWPGWVGAPDAGFVEDEATERRLAAAEWLAASVIDLLHVAAEYDDLWSVPQFLADEPAVIALKRALADWTQAAAK